jgi:hypothetical protein
LFNLFVLNNHSLLQRCQRQGPIPSVFENFIFLADSMKSAINVAWEHGGPDFQSRFHKSTVQAQEMKEGAQRVL